MKILLLESFYTSSHKIWADGLIANSTHDIQLLSLPGRHWKWRMHHAGKYFAFELMKIKNSGFDLILCSDLMNVAEFRGVLSSIGNKDSWFNNVKVATYFHENQITYPWSETDPDINLKRDNHYGWINYASCISSDYILFNSQFHKNSFVDALRPFIDQFPKVNQDDCIDAIAAKSYAIPVGLNLQILAERKKEINKKPVILWNHRWEYDKNPNLFFDTLIDLKSKGLDFELIIAGEKYKKYPEIFDVAKKALAEQIIHFGFAKNRTLYEQLLLKSDILAVTSNQDFFGISVIEGIAAGCIPILPNRLAFPEHLPEPQHQDYYYNTSEEFSQKIINHLKSTAPKSVKLRNYILKYDWETVGPLYDAFFHKVENDKLT